MEAIQTKSTRCLSATGDMGIYIQPCRLRTQFRPPSPRTAPTHPAIAHRLSRRSRWNAAGPAAVAARVRPAAGVRVRGVSRRGCVSAGCVVDLGTLSEGVGTYGHMNIGTSRQMDIKTSGHRDIVHGQLSSRTWLYYIIFYTLAIVFIQDGSALLLEALVVAD